MSDKQLSEMKIINRGHLGVPEEILKAGAAQYASMCGNINNKVRSIKFNLKNIYGSLVYVVQTRNSWRSTCLFEGWRSCF